MDVIFPAFQVMVELSNPLPFLVSDDESHLGEYLGEEELVAEFSLCNLESHLVLDVFAVGSPIVECCRHISSIPFLNQLFELFRFNSVENFVFFPDL